MTNAQAQASLRLLVDQGCARVYVDGMAPGVVVPPKCRQAIRLDIEHQFKAFEVNAEGFRVTLWFGGIPSRVVVPWTAVFGFENAAAVGMAQVQPGLWVLAGNRAQVTEASADVALLTQGTPEQRRKAFRVLPGGKHG